MSNTPVRKSARVAAKKAGKELDKSGDDLSENLQSTPIIPCSQRRRKNERPSPFTISNRGNQQAQQDSPLGTPNRVKTALGKRTMRNLIETPPIAADVSIVNDSFLNDLDKMESDARASQQQQLPPMSPDILDAFFSQTQVQPAKNTANSEINNISPAGIQLTEINASQLAIKSPDMFGDDTFDLDCLPASQFQLDPQTPAKHSAIISKNRSKKRKTSLPPPPPLVQRPDISDPPEVPPPKTRKPRTKKAAANTKDKEKKKKSKFKVAYTNRKAVKLISNSGNNELSRDDLTGMSEEEKLQLASWGLPQSVLNKYYSKGVRSLFDWQLECLTREGVLEGKNLLYSAPTSAGKTLVAELLMVKRVLELGKKAIMILPFVSVCREKMFSMQEILGDAGIRVEGFMGSYAPPGGFKSVDIAICTIEKANSLINRLLEEDALSQVGTVVVDELHLIGDSSRGTLLELILTKIKYMIGRTDASASTSTLSQAPTNSPRVQIQVIGMSATLPNLDLLASWMDAELVVSEYRPVPLVEHILLGTKLLNRELEVVRDVHLPTIPLRIPHDDNNLVYLSLETVLDGHSVLIFCPTRAKCEAIAQQIAQDFFNLGNPTNTAYSDFPEISQKLREQLSGQKLSEVMSQLKQCPGGLDENLKKSVAFGVAFHHAGLTYDERDIVESAFKRGVLRVIVATSTLSAGVNLPARRVIISTPMFNGGVLDPLTYRQMCGRAGRKGVDTQGESILVCTTTTKPHGITLVQSSLPNVRSALIGYEGALTSSMKRALLEVIASGIATRPEDVHKYARATLLSKSIDMGLFDADELSDSQSKKEETIMTCLRFLQEGEFIRLQTWEAEDKDDEYVATQLGSACLASSLAPDDGVTVYKELQKARRRFVLETDLHIVYQVTPIYLADGVRDISWLDFLNIWNDLNPGDKEVGKLTGVDETFIFRAMTGVYSKRNSALTERYAIHQRFFVALALNDLVNEMPISKVAQKYSLSKGLIQSLQQSASTFAGMVTSFCGKLGWSSMELLIGQFQDRLQFGVQRELCDLVRLSTMNGQRARVLYDAGIKTIAELAAAEPAHIEHILHKAAPFQSSVHGQTEESVARAIWVIGKNGGLSESEAARSIVAEARQFIQLELGLPGRIEFADELNEKEVNELDYKENNEINHSVVVQNSSVALSHSRKSINVSRRDNGSNNISKPETLENDLQNIFEDSLKDLFNDELEAKVSKEEMRAILDGVVDNSMDISDQSLLFNLSSSISKIDPRPLDCSEGIRHSTPSNEAGKIEFPYKRISAIHPQISTLVNQLETRRVQVQEDELHINAEEFEAAFGKDFDSVASLMEVSLNISIADDNTDLPKDHQKDKIPAEDSTKHLLSESDAAAVQAMVNDGSAFNSEDMFADLEISNEKASANRFGNLTSSSALVSACGDDTSSCLFESDPDVTNSGLQSARGRLSQEETMLEANVGENCNLKVMRVCSPNFIPNSIFISSQPLSMAFQLCSQKRTASANHGIGAKVVGRKKKMDDELGSHSISLYNGGNKIWVLECLADLDVTIRNFTKLFRRIRSPLILFDAKDRIKKLIHVCGLKTIPNDVWDPKVAQWMWKYDTEDFSTLSSSRLIELYVKEEHKKVQRLKWPKHVIETYMTWYVMEPLKDMLIEKKLWKHFTTIEMPSMIPLLLMELNGFRVDGLAMSKMKKALEVRAALLEMRAFELAGRQFNLSSPKEVKQILFRDLGLKQPSRTTGTGKDVLAKLNHELADIILEWRKVSSSLHKVMIPFLAERDLNTNRIHGRYSYLTVTGRTIMSDPSLQCVPRDFTLEIHFSHQEIAHLKSIPTSSSNVVRFGSKLNSIIKTLQNTELSPSQEGLFAVSLRSLFVASNPDFVLVSADYSQLELRILAHLSQDEKLINALNDTRIDVFIAIASQWKKLPPEQINDSMRQEAKGIVYGVIYGMGVRALSEAMEVEEADAARFVAEFMRSYPGVRTFLSESVKICHDRGYVETISGRRRYLPNIQSLNPALKSQAERQAVNTQIQGSAADLVKAAMTRIQSRLHEVCPNTCCPVQMNPKGIPNSPEVVCFPILNLHDELIFEVKNSHVPQITSLIKEVMESSLTLSVRLPVVIKSGTSWGKLRPVDFK